MDGHCFNDFVRSLTTGGATRRDITRALAALSLIGTLSPLFGLATAFAKKKKRKKKQKVTFNAFGCVNVGQFCKDAEQCCSGICQGKKDKRRCAAHNVDDCPAGADSCLEGLDLCTNGFCYQTTGEASFCAGGGICHDCTRDTDCELDWGEGAACVVCPVCAAGTSCVSVAYPGDQEPRR
jgi:hypothetical protein